MKKRLLFILICSYTAESQALINPFSCNRSQPQKQAPARPKPTIANVEVELVGITSLDGQRCALVRHHEQVHCVHAGERVGPLEIIDVATDSVRIRYKNKQMLLTQKDE
jgi:Tfp pilus assembly protein PilP